MGLERKAGTVGDSGRGRVRSQGWLSGGPLPAGKCRCEQGWGRAGHPEAPGWFIAGAQLGHSPPQGWWWPGWEWDSGRVFLGSRRRLWHQNYMVPEPLEVGRWSLEQFRGRCEGGRGAPACEG